MGRLFVLSVLACLALAHANPLPKDIQAAFRPVEQFTKLVKTKVPDRLGGLTMTVECGVCGIAINEVEAFILENITVAEMQQRLDAAVCTMFTGAAKTACDSFVADIPSVIEMIEQRQSVSTVCIELGYCDKPFAAHPDPFPMPQYTIDLDAPPEQRWTQICSNSTYQTVAKWLVQAFENLFSHMGDGKRLDEIGRWLNDQYFPAEFGAEIKGCAAALGVDYGFVALMNLGYEVSDACTSIVAQTTDGKIYHSRNLDFWDGMGFTDSLKDLAIEVDFQKGGQTLFKASTFAGFVGVLSGIRPNGFSLTIDTRFYPNGIGQLFYEVIAALTERNASLVTFLSREVLTDEADFEAALANLSDDELIADVYYIIAGMSAGEGAVISRNRLNASDVWRLDADSGRWFEVETNYDHWTQPPWFDDRLVPANNGMSAMGRSNLTLDGMFEVMTTKPVLNLQTVHTILACPADNSYTSFIRYCPYPCVE